MRLYILAIVGLSLYMPLFRGDYQANFFPTSYLGGFMPLAFNLCAVACALAAGVYSRKRIEVAMVSGKLLAAVGALSTASLIACAVLPGTATSCAAAPLFAAYFVLSSAGWGLAVCRMTQSAPAETALCIAAAYFLGFVVTLPANAFPDATQALYSVFPLLSCAVLALLLSGREVSPAAPPLDGGDREEAHPLALPPRMMPPVLLAIVSFEVVSAFAVGLYVPMPEVGQAAGTAIWNRTVISMFVALALVACVALSMRFPAVQFVAWGLAAMLILAGAMLFTSGDAPIISVGRDVLTVGRRTAWVLVLMLLPIATLGSCRPWLLVYGCAFPLAYEATRIVINALRALVDLESANTELVATVALVISVILMFVVLAMFGSIASSAVVLGASVKHGKAARNVDTGEDAHKAACLAVSRRFGLTERESATFVLLSQGFTAKRIAMEEQVAETTVRTHMKAIYRKTSCHSKQEIIDLVNEELGGK